MVRVSAWAVFTGATLGFGLWSLVSLMPALNRPRLARRIAPYLLDISAGAREIIAPVRPGPLSVLGVLVEPLAARVRPLFGAGHLLSRRLRQAGSTLTLEAFRSQQLLCGIAGVMVAVAASFGMPHLPLPVKLVICAVAAAGGVLLRDYVLQRAATRRLARLSAELPVVLEFLTLSLSAGEGMLDGLRRVGRVSRGELAGELRAVVASVGTGLPLGETLTALAADLDLPALSRCVEQIVGALERGTPLAEVLRAQAQDSRDDAKQHLLEVAGKKEIAMMVPLVFGVLPVTIAFAIFPGIVVLQLGF